MNPFSLNWWKSILSGAPQKAKKKNLRESAYNIDFALNSYADLLNRFYDGGVYSYPITNPYDRRYGSNYPFWYSEQQLNLIRAQARLLVTTNPNAQGLLNGLCSYVIGPGYGYRVMPKAGYEIDQQTLQRVDDTLKRFIDDNDWETMEQEVFTRSREDGECFLRYFPQPSGRLLIRTIEPEQIYQPPSSDFAEWSYGIQTELDDVFTILAYHVDYEAPRGSEEAHRERTGEVVPASDIVHIKCNVKRSIKRGLSDFSYDTLDTFVTAGKLRKNLGEGSAVQSAIAAIRQHETATKEQVEDFVQENIDYTAYSGIPQRETDYQRIEPGSFLDIPKGMEYVAPPGAENAESHLRIFQSLLRSAGNRLNAPEWLASADVSNANYASSLTAESPFLRTCVRLQTFYKRHFTRIAREAILTAAEAGDLPIAIVDAIDVIVTPPNVEARDKIAESTSNQTYVAMGIKSKQTIAQELGLDWDQEKRNMDLDQDDQELAASDIEGGGDMAQVSDQALNGLQIENLVGIVTRVAAGQLTTEVGKAVAAAAFPLMSSDQIAAIFPESLYKSAMHTTPTKQPGEPSLPSEPSEPEMPSEPTQPEPVAESIDEAEGGKYSHINFSPPASARKAAKRGLELRRKLGRGGTAVGIARARDISNGKEMSPSTVKRMFSFFSRHEVDKQGEGWGKDSNGYVAWLLWGGDSGFAWSRKVRNQMDAADKKGSKKKSVNELQYGRPKKDDPRKTPAKPHEKRKGSKRNPKGSASKSNKGIEVSADTQKKIRELMKKHNEKNPDFRASMATLKSVFRRGAGAFSTSHAPGMDRTRWGLKRIEAFLYLLRNGRPSNPNYKQDNDLLPSEHGRSSKGES